MIATLRLARVGLHLAGGLATVAIVYPFVRRSVQLKLKRRWSRQLVGMLGVRIEAAAAPLAAPALLVSNHISWLDIFVINAVAPAAFVCKAEVRGWPAIGWLCERTETVFMPRGSRSAARQASDLVAERLRQGWLVAVFPEGTTSEGDDLLPFHGALLQGAVDAGCRVQPLALGYVGSNGSPSSVPAYCGDTTLLQSLHRIARTPGLRARIAPLPVLDAHAAERRTLAAAARASIELALRKTRAEPSGHCEREDASPEVRPAAA